jgi:hypothetical protein
LHEWREDFPPKAFDADRIDGFVTVHTPGSSEGVE